MPAAIEEVPGLIRSLPISTSITLHLAAMPRGLNGWLPLFEWIMNTHHEPKLLLAALTQARDR
jgi:hypothetical protein